MKFQIDRAKWGRGGSSGPFGPSALINELGYMCCLGFYCKALEVPDNKMYGASYPSWVGEPLNDPHQIFFASSRRMSLSSVSAPVNLENWETILAVINDAPNVEDSIREAWITEGFRVLGHEAEFVGP